MENKKLVLVFDADDTLWMNVWQYDWATVKFFDYMFRLFRGRIPNFHDLKDCYYEIDGKLQKGEWGIKQGRVSESMARLYKEVCQWSKKRFGIDFYSTGDEAEIRSFGDLPFDFEELEWLPEAHQALAELKNAGHTLCFLSSYDSRVFPKRRHFLNLKEFFPLKRVKTTEFRKTKQDFIDASGWTPENDGENIWIAIGNAKSDIEPALSISEKWYGIHIPHGSTSQYCEHGKGVNRFTPPLYKDPRVVNIRSLTKIQLALRKILRKAITAR